jgi:putative membrane protein
MKVVREIESPFAERSAGRSRSSHRLSSPARAYARPYNRSHRRGKHVPNGTDVSAVRSLCRGSIVADLVDSEDKMKISPIVAAVFLCAANSVSLAQNTDESAHSSISATEFIQKAGEGGQAEVEMGQLGAKKATNGEVKAFAKRMVADHTKANGELVAVAKGKGEVPASRDTMHKAMMDKFQEQDAGKQFDRDYMEQMVQDHQTDVELFETAADDTKLDVDLRAYAKKTLPTLRDHLKQAQTIQAKLAD